MMTDSDFEIHANEMSTTELLPLLVNELSCGGGMVSHPHVTTDGSDMTDIFSIQVVMLNGDKHQLLFNTDQTKFLLLRLLKYAAGRMDSEKHNE